MSCKDLADVRVLEAPKAQTGFPLARTSGKDPGRGIVSQHDQLLRVDHEDPVGHAGDDRGALRSLGCQLQEAPFPFRKEMFGAPASAPVSPAHS